MKGLSLTQPFATLIAVGSKRIDTRSWHTPYRGPVVIHAAKGFPKEARELCYREPFRSAIDPEKCHGGKDLLGLLPLGAIVAVGFVMDCVAIGKIITHYDRPSDRMEIGAGEYTVPPNEPERSFGDYTPGRFAWMLADVRRLPVPIPCKGSLLLWRVPPDVEAEIVRQLPGLEKA